MKQEQKNERVSKKFEIDTACYRQTGRGHRHSRGECEDTILTIEKQKFRFYGLADGQGGKGYGASGGKACLQVLANYIQNQGVEQVMNYPFRDELPCTIMKQVRACILNLAQKNGGDFSEYASTLLAIAVDPVSGKYVFFHLGDGGLIGIRKEQDIILLSPPENGFTPSIHG